MKTGVFTKSEAIARRLAFEEIYSGFKRDVFVDFVRANEPKFYYLDVKKQLVEIFAKYLLYIIRYYIMSICNF